MISGAAVHTAIQNDVIRAAAPANADDENRFNAGLLIVLAVQILNRQGRGRSTLGLPVRLERRVPAPPLTKCKIDSGSRCDTEKPIRAMLIWCGALRP